MYEKIEVIPVRGLPKQSEREEGVSFYYKLGRYGIIVDAGIHPQEQKDIDHQELIQAYRDLDRHLDAILLTHGHADHARFAPILANYFKIPIYTTPTVKRYIRNWAEQDQINFDALKITVIKEGQKLYFGNAMINIVEWAHSIPEALGFDIQIGDKHIVHLGDGKLTGFDKSSFNINLEKIKNLAKRPVDLLTVDALKAARRSRITKPEGPVVKNIAEVILKNPGKNNFVFLYSSNHDRIQAIINYILDYTNHSEDFNQVKADGIRFLFRGNAMNKTAEMIGEAAQLPSLKKDLNLPSAKTTVVFGTVGGEHSYDKYLIKDADDKRPDKDGVILSEGDNVIFSCGYIPEPDPEENREKEERERNVVKTLYERKVNIYATYGHARYLQIKPYVKKIGNYNVGGHEGQEGMQLIFNALRASMVLPFHLQRGEHTVLQRMLGEISFVLEQNNFDIIPLGRVKKGE